MVRTALGGFYSGGGGDEGQNLCGQLACYDLNKFGLLERRASVVSPGDHLKGGKDNNNECPAEKKLSLGKSAGTSLGGNLPNRHCSGLFNVTNQPRWVSQGVPAPHSAAPWSPLRQ